MQSLHGLVFWCSCIQIYTHAQLREKAILETGETPSWSLVERQHPIQKPLLNPTQSFQPTAVCLTPPKSWSTVHHKISASRGHSLLQVCALIQCIHVITSRTTLHNYVQDISPIIYLIIGLFTPYQLTPTSQDTHIKIRGCSRHESSLNEVNARCVGLMWSIFLIGRIYLNGLWQGLLLRADIRKTCLTMRSNSALNLNTILGLIVHLLSRAYVVTSEEYNFKFDLLEFCDDHIWNLEWQLPDSQMLTWWNQSDPTIWTVWSGSAHNRLTCFRD